MPFADSKQRFSNRVADYVRYRPGYPAGALDWLRANCGLLREHAVADIGSGTGLLSKLFLDHGNSVFGVEPNAEMRAAGEEFLGAYDRFTSVDGSAETTTLADSGVQYVAAGQAFHWFDPNAAFAEFRRILGAGGYTVILWNERLTDSTLFLRDYESFLRRFGTDYARVSDSYPGPEQMRAFFGANEFASHELPNAQEFDLASLSGRLRSSSYIPAPDHPGFPRMMTELRRIFEVHQKEGLVRMEYRTRIYAGQLQRGRD